MNERKSKLEAIAFSVWQADCNEMPRAVFFIITVILL